MHPLNQGSALPFRQGVRIRPPLASASLSRRARTCPDMPGTGWTVLYGNVSLSHSSSTSPRRSNLPKAVTNSSARRSTERWRKKNSNKEKRVDTKNKTRKRHWRVRWLLRISGISPIVWRWDRSERILQVWRRSPSPDQDTPPERQVVYHRVSDRWLSEVIRAWSERIIDSQYIAVKPAAWRVIERLHMFLSFTFACIINAASLELQ